ncbi:hypothetical protein [Coleofasciculus sp. FACHB-T130]|uniref:hypothetical protein n=1 Tax=Cyanophyceae TaxID=3028117 RepID=UPI0016881FC0|nr:hypothetical protein [Coleofasciculus sp. FACHB-T130]MBD1878237.1 hypothetical protein [Coleofasciculus sp. FACHB-T130]
MEAFDSVPPKWIESATHARKFCCPNCRASSREAQQVWLNRRSPVMTEDYRRKWQEFYQCQCGSVWWAWSNDRPPSDLLKREPPTIDE